MCLFLYNTDKHIKGSDILQIAVDYIFEQVNYVPRLS